MAKIEVGGTANMFKLDGLEYNKGAYEVTYDNVERNDAGTISESIIRVGLRHIAGRNSLQAPILITDWVNTSDVAYSDLDTLLSDLGNIVGFSGPGSGAGTGVSPNHVFSGADRAAAEAARDAYFTSNPTELTVGLEIIITFGTTAIQQVRTASDTWADLDTTLTGATIKTLYESNADTNAFTDALLTKLNGIATGAEVNVQADWNETDTNDDSFIQNKPTDVTDLSTHSATELNDISNAGSGQIITATERTNLGDSFSAVTESDGTVSFTQNDSGVTEIDLPPGMLMLDDVEITANVTITPANLSTYRDRTVINRNTDSINIEADFDTLANFRTASTTDFFVTFVNESASNQFIIRPGASNFLAQRNNITLNQGQSITVKYPVGGTRWNLVADSLPGTGTTQPPVTPQPTPAGTVILQTAQWDPTSGSLPSGGSAGFLYRVSTTGTFDGETFRDHDLLLQLVNNASTLALGTDWQRINGDDYVVTWGGLSGVIDDNDIETVLTRIGYETVAPSVHNFSINIASRVDIGTDLNISRTLTYDITNRNSISSFELLVVTGDNKTLVNPTTDGTQSQDVTLTGIDTSSAGTVTFQLQITDTNSNTHDSNIVTITIQNLQPHEQVHFGFVGAAENQNNIVFGTGPSDPASTDTEVRDQADGNWTVSGIPTDSSLHRIYWAVPVAEGSITSVTQSGFNITNQFTNVPSVAIGGQNFNVFLMNANAAVNSNYNGTILTVG